MLVGAIDALNDHLRPRHPFLVIEIDLEVKSVELAGLDLSPNFDGNLPIHPESKTGRTGLL